MRGHHVPHTEEAKRKMSRSKLGVSATWNIRPSREENGITLYRCGMCRSFFAIEDHRSPEQVVWVYEFRRMT